MTKGQIYKGFKVIDIRKVPEASNAEGIYLRHEKSGMEVFHLYNKDPENFFSFCFKTPSSNSKGIAHIVEHTTLCGSRKYPLKDPFISMEGRSLNTFLNAMTFPDHTTYPAASFIPEDYFNLMGVYADAVFFPLLREESFMQEGTRLELDKDGKYSLQGVVFNEMSGVYSNQVNIISRNLTQNSYKGTQYEYDSGGDPLEIPSLTYEEYKAFYKKYYCTQNCFVYLYGNIPTKPQLDFLEENVISKVSSYGRPTDFNCNPNKLNPEKYLKILVPSNDEDQDTKKDTVNIDWVIECDKKNYGQVTSELFFLERLLQGLDSSPLKRQLLESGFGKDLSMQSGASPNTLLPDFTIGLSGTDGKDAKKIEKKVLEILKSLADKTFDSQLIEDTVHSAKMTFRIVLAYDKNQGRRYMNSVLAGAYYGDDPYLKLYFENSLDEIYEKAKSDPSYIPSLIKEYFLENPHRSVLVAVPSSKYVDMREKKLKSSLSLIKKNTDKKVLLEKLKEMSELQNKDESELSEKLLPKTELKNLKRKPSKYNVKYEKVSDVPFISCSSEIKGMIYFQISFPVDVLLANEYEKAALLPYLIGDAGWKGCKWDQAEILLNRYTQGISSSINTFNNPESRRKNLPYKNLFNRDFLEINLLCMEEDFEKTLKLLKDCILNTDFNDLERIEQLLQMNFEQAKMMLSGSSHMIARGRNSCFLSKKNTITELVNGYVSVLNLSKTLKSSIKKLSLELKNVYSKIISSGAFISVIADTREIKKVKSYMNDFVKDLQLSDLIPEKNNSPEDFYKLIELKGKDLKRKENNDFNIREILEIPGSVGYASLITPAYSLGCRDFAIETIFGSCLSNGLLWKKVRMEGGAYGVFLSASPSSGLSYLTYRDPDPMRSLESYKAVLEELKESDFSQEEIVHALISYFSSFFKSESPLSKGLNAIDSFLCGRTYQSKRRMQKWILSVTPLDLKRACEDYLNKLSQAVGVVACSKSQISSKIKENTSKIVNLRL